MTAASRIGPPIGFIFVVGVTIVSPDLIWGIPLAILGYQSWISWSLCDVWLDGDELQVQSRRESFRVPLADLMFLETASLGHGRVIVLGLDHPVGKIEKVRFIPNPDTMDKDLQARIHAARAARKS